MTDEQDDGENERIVKRPNVSAKKFHQIKTIADGNVAISADELSWEKCLEIVIDEYVPGQDKKLSQVHKRLRAERESND